MLNKSKILKRIEELTKKAEEDNIPFLAFLRLPNIVEEHFDNGKTVIREVENLDDYKGARVIISGEEELED